MVSKSLRSPLAAALAAGVAALAAAGCGGEAPADTARGKELFTQKCGACHQLANANTKGVQGPNLDLAFKQSVADGLGRSTIAGVVRDQIDLPMGSQMPADLYKGDDANDVAEYVASAIGKPRGGRRRRRARGNREGRRQERRRDPDRPQRPARLPGQEGHGQAGQGHPQSKNDASVPHDIAIKGDGKGPVVQGGKVSEVSTTLKAGSYEFYCSVPGHEQAGMKGTLTVK